MSISVHQIEGRLELDDLECVEQLAYDCARKGIAPLHLPGLSDEFPLFEKVSAIANQFADLIPSSDIWDWNDLAVISIVQPLLNRLHMRALTDRDFFYNTGAGAIPSFRQIASDQDDDWGLVTTNLLEGERQWYSFDNKEIHIAQALPGTLNSSLFLSQFLCPGPSSDKILIRPDVFRIRPIGSSYELMERARTYGKPFNKEWLKNLKGIQTAQHDPNPDEVLSPGITTQFIWERLDGDEVQFSCEELPNFQAPHKVGDENTTTRFMHGIYDIKKEVFNHFDGAIHIYAQTQYQQRLQKTLKDHFKSYLKAKIFRIDLPLDLQKAEHILSVFYRWNSLVTEYFTHH